MDRIVVKRITSWYSIQYSISTEFNTRHVDNLFTIIRFSLLQIALYLHYYYYELTEIRFKLFPDNVSNGNRLKLNLWLIVSFRCFFFFFQ